MLQYLQSKLCCNPRTPSLSIFTEIVHSKRPFDFQSTDLTDKLEQAKYSASYDSLLDPEDYYFSVLVDFHYGGVNFGNDFLYFCKEENPLLRNIKDLDPQLIAPVNTDKSNLASGYCYFSLQPIDFSKTYKIYYIRRDEDTGRLQTFNSTNKFKIGFKNRIYNLFLDSVPDRSMQGLALFYDNDPFFEKINAKKIARIFKNSQYTSMNDLTVMTSSTKNTSISKNSSIFPRSAKTSMSLMRNSIGSESLVRSSGTSISINRDTQGTLRKSFAWSKKKSMDLTQQGTIGRCLYNEGLKECVKDLKEIEEFMKGTEGEGDANDSVIVNEDKENDEYIRKMCKVLDENLQTKGDLQRKDSTGDLFGLSDSRTFFSGNKNSTNTRGSVGGSQDFSRNLRQQSGDKGEGISSEEIEPSFLCEKGSPSANKAAVVKSSEELFERTPMNFDQRRKARDFSSVGFEAIQKISEEKESSDKKCVNLNASEVIVEQTEEDQEEDFDSKPIFDPNFIQLERNNYCQFEFEEEEGSQSGIEYMSENDQDESPDYFDMELPQYTPRYSNRLYTVEEVCSASKEGSIGWERKLKVFNSGSVSQRNRPNSTRYQKDKNLRGDQNEGYEGKNLDFENISSPVTQASLKELPLEVMILKQKVEELGLKLEYVHKDFTVFITDKNKMGIVHTLKWYEGTSDKDLYDYFDGAIESIKLSIATKGLGK